MIYLVLAKSRIYLLFEEFDYGDFLGFLHFLVLAWRLILQLLLKLEDNRLIETVGIPVMDGTGLSRLTACVSSQVFSLFPEVFVQLIW